MVKCDGLFHVKSSIANKTDTIASEGWDPAVPLPAHRSKTIACKALRAERLARVFFRVPKRIPEDVVILFEAQLFLKVSVFLFEA